MLRPKDIRENLDNFNGVARDAIEHMVTIRGADDVIPDLEGEIAKWATECKFCRTWNAQGLYSKDPRITTFVI